MVAGSEQDPFAEIQTICKATGNKARRGCYLQASPVLTEGSLYLQLFLYSCISQLGSMPFHLCSSPEGAFQSPWLVLHLLQFTLQAVKFRFSLHPSNCC